MNSTLSSVKPIDSASEYDEAFNEYMGMELNTPQESEARKRLQDYRLKSGMTPGDFGQFTNTKKVNALDTMLQSEFRDLGDDEVKGINDALGLNAYEVFKRADEKGKALMFSVSYADAAVGGNARGNLAQLGYMLKAKDYENTEEVYGILKERVRQAHDEHTKKWDALKGPMEADYQQMVRAVSQGEVFQSQIPEMAKANESAKKAGEFMKRMAYGDDRVSPQAQGMHTGVGGLVNYGYSPSREGGWVEELVMLKNDDPDAYGFAMEALQSLAVAHTSKDITFAEKFSRSFIENWAVGMARFGDDLLNDAMESVGIGMADKHKDIPNWKKLSDEVVNDLGNVRQGSYKSDKGGFVGWIDDFGNMAGGSSAFIFKGGVPALFSLAQTSKESYAGKNSADSLARWKGVFEGGAVLAVNKLGVNSLGKIFGKRYDVWAYDLAKKLGNNRALGRVLASDRWMIRFPTHMAMAQVGEFSQEVVEPFAQYFAGNAISLGGGMEWSDALEQARAVFEPSNVGHMITYGFLIGGAGHMQNMNSRGEFLKTVQNRRILLDTANSPKTLRDIGLSEEKVQSIINERKPDDQIKLMQYAIKEHAVEQSIGGEDVAIVLPPESDYVQDAMRDKRMAEYRRLNDGRYERIALDGESEFIDAESATKLIQTEASELMQADMKLFREADIENDLIDYFVEKDPSLEFIKLNKKLDLRAMEELRDAVFKGDYAIFDEYESTGKLKEYAQSEEGKAHLAILPKSLRARAEYEASVTGKAVTGNEYAAAFNIRTSTARKLVGFYNNDLTAYNLVEERAELYVKQELANGRELGWIGDNLIMTQRELKAQKVKGWQLVPEGKKVEELSEMEVIEGVSRLGKAIFAQEYRTRQLPEMVQRFLDIVSALCNEVKDWIRLASAFKKAVNEGKIDEDFASFIYQGSEGLIDHQAKQTEANIEQKVGKKRKRYNLTKKVTERVDFALGEGGDEFSLQKEIEDMQSAVIIEADEVVSSASEMRAKLKPLQGKVFVNKNTGLQAVIEARVSGKTVGKAGASQMSVANLKALGYSVEEARKIHYTAATRMHELFENAPDAFFEESYKGDSARAGAYHLFNSVEIEGIGSFDVNVTAISFKEDKSNTIYTLELTIENPATRGATSQKDRLSTPSKDGVSIGKLASYRSFVEKEMRDIKTKAQDDGTYLKAPNGEETKLNEKQWLQVRTKAFKEWFGDWENDAENASKVMDENGEPMVVYHGTKNDFTIFKKDKIGSATDHGIWGTGFYFGPENTPYGDIKMPVFLNIKNPFDVSSFDTTDQIADYLYLVEDNFRDISYRGLKTKVAFSQNPFVISNITSEIKYKGHDGVCVNMSEKWTEYVIFEPNQIKSATNNRGTFDGGDARIDFALDSGVRMSLEEMASRAHVSAVRDYFSSVLEKTDSELANLRRLFEGKVDDKAMKVLEARAAFRLALNALPKSAREQVKNYEEVVDHVLNAYAKGHLNVDEVLSEDMVKRVSRLFGLQEGVLLVFAGKKLEDAIITMYERCNTVMNRHARDEMHEVAMKMIKASSPVLDESTKKYKVGIIGARAQEFLQDTLKPIFESTQATAANRIAELKAQMIALEDGKGLEENDGASIESLQSEYVLWEAYGACKSLSAERMLGALEYLENFLDQSKNAWLMEQSERVDKWNAERDEAKAAFKQKQTEMKRKKAMAEYNNTNDHGLARKLSSAIAEAVENPIKALERYGEKSGAGKFFRALAEESVRAQNEIHYDRERDAREFREKLMKLTGSKNEVEFNAWYDWVNKPIKLEGKTAPFGTRRRDLTLEHAAEIYQRRKRDPWFGYATYSQQSIDALMEAYERWLSGEDKSTKWLHVEEYVKMQGEELELTPGEMMHILMTSERYFARRIYAKKGYEPLYAEMRKHIGPQGESVMEMMFEMYAKLGDRVRPLYEARYGVPFSKNRRYAPLRWITVDNLKDVDLAQLLQTTGDVAVGRVDGFLSATEMHNRDVDLTTNALNLFWQHHSAVNNWVHTQELVRKYRYMLSNASFAQDMLVNLGGTDYKLFNNYLNNLEKGGIAKAQAQGELMKFLSNGVNTMSVSVLAGQISSLVKQAGNIFNALYGSDISLIDWAKGLARVLSGKSLYSVKEFYGSDLFEPRKNAFFNSVLMGYKRQLGGKFGWVEKMSEVPMSWLGKADTYTNAVSFVALFDHHYRNFMKLGMSSEDAHESAVKEVELGLSRIAAPVDFTQKAKVLSDDNSVANQSLFWLKVEALGKLASVTRHISRANQLRKEGDTKAMWKHTRLAVRSWMLQGASMQALGYLVGLAMGDPDDEDRLNPLNFVPGIMMGPLNGMPIIGDLFSKPIGWVVEEPFNSLSEKMGFDYRFKDYGGGMNQFIFNWKDVLQMVDYFKGDKDLDELKDMGELSRKGSKATGLFAVLSSFSTGRKKMIMTSSALAMTAVLNMAKYFAGVADNIDHALSD